MMYLENSNNDRRVIQTFIDNGTGEEIPYWTLNDLSKLKLHDKVKDKNGFVEAAKQGSGYRHKTFIFSVTNLQWNKFMT